MEVFIYKDYLIPTMDILGVCVDNLARKEILERIEGFLDEPKFHQIATINPEFILEAQKNPEFKEILNRCDLKIADGCGLNLSAIKTGKRLKCRLAGADLIREILKMAENRGLGVYLACLDGGLSRYDEISRALSGLYPKLKISGKDIKKSDTFWKSNGTEIDEPVLLCNFGAPEQEAFINSIKSDKIRLAMGVGGSFDFLTGKVRRAPVFLRRIGLEWLWRLIAQPRRLKRIIRATIIFPWKVIFTD